MYRNMLMPPLIQKDGNEYGRKKVSKHKMQIVIINSNWSSSRDFKSPPRSIRELRSSGLLRSE